MRYLESVLLRKVRCCLSLECIRLLGMFCCFAGVNTIAKQFRILVALVLFSYIDGAHSPVFLTPDLIKLVGSVDSKIVIHEM